jgi:antitoxin (DNA-binding transcriptional repressor) of toxin-antitoxin stability system
MTAVASRDLRNHTADVLRQVAAGTPVTITVNGVPVADITAHRAGRRGALSRHELLDIVQHRQADPGLRDDLRDMAGDDTDALGPLP